MTDYAATLAAHQTPAAVAADVKRGRVLLAKYGPWLRRYHGGIPVGILTANMMYESGGNETVWGDLSLGEYGLFQVTTYYPPLFGLPAAARFDPQTNVFLGCLEHQYEAASMAKKFSVPMGSVDQWKLARLSLSIGAHGATVLLGKALAAGSPGSSLFDKIRAYVDQTGGVAVSTSQPAAKVWYRVHWVDHVFEIGQKIEYGFYGPPELIPAPPGVRYTFPPSLLPYTGRPMGGMLLALGCLTAAAFLIARAT